MDVKEIILGIAKCRIKIKRDFFCLNATTVTQKIVAYISRAGGLHYTIRHFYCKMFDFAFHAHKISL